MFNWRILNIVTLRFCNINEASAKLLNECSGGREPHLRNLALGFIDVANIMSAIQLLLAIII